jgi:hypothetical protein
MSEKFVRNVRGIIPGNFELSDDEIGRLVSTLPGGQHEHAVIVNFDVEVEADTNVSRRDLNERLMIKGQELLREALQDMHRDYGLVEILP